MDRRTRLLFAAICGVAVAAVYAAQPVAARIAGDLDWAPDAVGWLVATGQLGYLAGLVLLVPLGDAHDRTRLLVVHLVLVGVGAVVVACAPSAWVVLTGLAVSGLFAVVVQTAVAYAAALAAPADRGRTLGTVTAGVVTGILGSRFLAGLLTELWGWRSVYVALGVLAAVLATLAHLLLPTDRRATDRGATTRRAVDGPPEQGRAVDGRPRTDGYGQVLRHAVRVLRSPVVTGRGLLAFFLFASFGSLWSGMALPLAAAPWYLGDAAIGLFGLAGLAGALTAGRAGRWADSGHGERVTGLALGALFVSWAAIGQLTWSMSLFVIGVVLLDAAVQAVHVSNQHTLTAAHPDRPSSAIAAYMVFYSTGSAVGAVATTALYDLVGWWGSSVLGGALAVAGLAVWVFGRTSRQQRENGHIVRSAR